MREIMSSRMVLPVTSPIAFSAASISISTMSGVSEDFMAFIASMIADFARVMVSYCLVFVMISPISVVPGSGNSFCIVASRSGSPSPVRADTQIVECFCRGDQWSPLGAQCAPLHS